MTGHHHQSSEEVDLEKYPLSITNEYTTVYVRTVEVGNGTRLEIYSPKTSNRIRLDPLQAESLCWQDQELFSEFLKEPFGPLE